MTDRQHRWYLREWSRAWRKHWAGTRQGEVIARPGRPAHPLRETIVAIARQLAGRNPDDGRLTADCLRHACHVHALGRDHGSWQLTNRQLDKVVAVFRLLADDSDLKARMTLDAPAGMADQARVIHAIANSGFAPAYVEAISRDKFATSNWRGLDPARQRQLLVTIKCRAMARSVADHRMAETHAPA